MLISTVRLSQIVKLVAIVCAITLNGLSAQAQTEFESIARNLERIGHVCLAGQDCAANAASTTAATSAPTAAPATVQAAPATAQAAPAAVPAAAPAFDAAATYQLSCFACHGSGAAGAPVLGDSAVWEERMAKGMDTVLANAMNGLGAMPAKGMCMTCSEDDMRTLIDYLVEGGQ